MPDWVINVLTIVASIGASSGFWAYLQKRDTRRDATTQLLLGLAHDRIIYLGMSYIDRGWISKDEYEDIMKYLYVPYSSFGGNGLAEKIMADVKSLPMRGVTKTTIKVVKEPHEQQHVEVYEQ
jgi:hypothetical protein